jgi:pimeloyl-ACP methyl ester carboxylesterase
MDSSVFDNRIFHDIATYLSSSGIAVLRYDKRTLAHGAAFIQTFEDMGTVWDEVVEDALLAAEILQNDPRISNVFVAGNSLGGMLSPRIAEEGGLEGAILLGASPRPLFEVQYDQNIQVINDAVLAGQMSQEEADGNLAMVAAMLEEAQNLPNLSDEEMQGMLVFGLSAIYQRSILDSLPLPIISRNTIPTLIMHGDRDFQVWTDSDFNVFVEHTQGYAHVQTILYDGLTHLFTPAQTDFNDIREYMVRGRVDGQVLRDIVEWIKNIR